MFSSLLGADPPAEEEDKRDPAEAGDEGASTSEGGAGPKVWNLWGNVASVVSNTVKARADELVKAVQDTDWKAELTAFGKEVKDDTQKVKARTAELVEQLPEAMEQLPDKVQVQLPPSTDVGHAIEAVQGSLSRLGKTLFSGTKDMIEQLREGVEQEIAVATKETRKAGRAATKPTGSAATAKLGAALQGSGKKYSRLEAEVAAMQRDSGTYCDEPEDIADFERWRESSGFTVEGAQPAIKKLLAENSFMSELHARIVPVIVTPEDFWTRYFYRLHKLQHKEEQRAALAQRAQASQQEEELGWDDLDAEVEPQAGAASSTPAEPAEGEDGSSRATSAPTQQQQDEAPSTSSPSLPASKAAKAGTPPKASQKKGKGREEAAPPEDSPATVASAVASTAVVAAGTASAGPSSDQLPSDASTKPGSQAASDWCVVSERSGSPDTTGVADAVTAGTSSAGGSAGGVDPSAAAAAPEAAAVASPPAQPAPASPAPKSAAAPAPSPSAAPAPAASPAVSPSAPAAAAAADEEDDEEDYLDWGSPSASGATKEAAPAAAAGKSAAAAPPGSKPGEKAAGKGAAGKAGPAKGDGEESPVDEDWGDWD